MNDVSGPSPEETNQTTGEPTSPGRSSDGNFAPMSQPGQLDHQNHPGQPALEGQPPQAPNDQAPNDQAPNDQAPNDQAPNDQAPNDQAPNEPSDVDDGYHSLAPEYVTLERRIGYVVNTVIYFILLGSSSPIVFFQWHRSWVLALVLLGWIALAALFVFFAHSWPKIAFKHTRWRFTEEGMEIKRGVLWKHRIAIPVARVQHVDVSQGPLQRMFALGKLTIHTAGTKDASIELDGLNHGQALELRDELIQQKESLDVI